LPPGYIASSANGIDSQGDVVGWAQDSNHVFHAVEWAPNSVPLPAGFWPAAGVLLAITVMIERSRLGRAHSGS
jgi:probable HAF family extracellular repeat protein